ncbi:DNA polymerase III subunit beta [Mesorhizobium sp. L-8-10]|uniref:DNA polymerase III subunit beta n=1 Tax=Mesorhizobium sp. L-8-10 TaxID=2744523 RepID=UPI00192533B9|nr:DNA polymerase III subunit beta [Mesorhizobium sp. L-8-10]BCH33197.1 DNA polymerase III subunit beta [Mesorhizobium sp. L-8-10]
MNAFSHNSHYSTASAIALTANVVAFPPIRRADPAPEPVDTSIVIDGEVIATDDRGNPLDGGPLDAAENSEEPGDTAPEDSAPDAKPVELPASAMVDRAALTKAFDIVKRVVERRSTVPILSNAMLAANGESIAITATDLDKEIRVTVPAAIDAHFATTVPAHMLETFLKKAAKGDFVALNTHPSIDAATVEFERVKYRLNTLPVADFPMLTAGEFPHRFTMSGKEFWSMVDGTRCAVSTEETRYYLNGIFMHVLELGNRNVLRLVATDGHRLYMQETTAPDGAGPDMGGRGGGDFMPGAIIPRGTIELVYALTKGKACPDSIDVAVSDRYVEFAFDNVKIVSKLIDGTFPDYQRVIPTGNDKVATFDAAEMLEAVESVSLISHERGRAAKFTLEDGQCVLSVNNPDSGSATATIACRFKGQGDEPVSVEIGFNTGYLKSLLGDAAPDGGEIIGEFSDAGSPTVFRGTREGWTGVLMPMRV